jgi:hypothetical protein
MTNRDSFNDGEPKIVRKRHLREFAKGKKAWGICDRSGFEYLLKDLVREPGTNLLVHKSLTDGKYNRVQHPQNFAADTRENIAIKNPRPDTTTFDEVLLKDSNGSVIVNSNGLPYFTYNEKTITGEKYAPPPTFYEDLIAWYDAADTSTILTENGVFYWRDKSNNEFHLSQSTASRFPTSGTESFGKNVLTFDGTDYLNVDFGQTYGQTNTLFVVCEFTSVNTTQYVVDGFATGYRNAFLNYLGAFSTFGGSLFQTGGVSDTNSNIHMIEFNGVTSKIYQNNVLKTTGNPGSNGLNGLTVGSSRDPAFFFSGKIMDIFAYNRVITENERNDIHLYLSRKWRIST